MKQIIALLILLTCSESLIGDPPDFSSREAQRALAAYEKSIKAADLKFLKGLQDALKVAMKEGELEEANLIQEQIDKLKSRYVALELGNAVVVTVNANKPKATGIKLKKGQRFSLDPNRDDKWTGGGTKRGVFCDYMGYDDRGNTWMRMMYRVGKEKGIPVQAGQIQTANHEGELFLYAADSRPKANTGKIRVRVTVSP